MTPPFFYFELHQNKKIRKKKLYIHIYIYYEIIEKKEWHPSQLGSRNLKPWETKFPSILH
jgi:hypothetical protein